MEQKDFWEVLDRNFVISMLIQKNINYEDSEKVIETFIEILNSVEESEKNHITNHLNESLDVRSAALCYEAMGAFQLLKNKLYGEEND